MNHTEIKIAQLEKDRAKLLKENRKLNQVISDTKKQFKQKEIELYEFTEQDTETLSEICLEYLNAKGIYPEVWSFQLKCSVDTVLDYEGNEIKH